MKNVSPKSDDKTDQSTNHGHQTKYRAFNAVYILWSKIRNVSEFVTLLIVRIK